MSWRRWQPLPLQSLFVLLVVCAGCDGIGAPPFEPVGAHVAIEVSATRGAAPGRAVVGAVEEQTGATIRLHAVLEAVEDGQTVYHTNAQALVIDGNEVPADRLRPWPDRPPLRCLWQTLQAAAPYTEVGSLERLRSIDLTNYSHPDWGLSCSTIATITARQRETMTVPDDARKLAFGRQNYQVHIEILDDETDLVSQSRFTSAGPEELLAAPDDFPRIWLRLPEPLLAASSVFGLSQLALAEGAGEELRAEATRLHQQGLFFEQGLLIEELLAERDGVWRLVELDGSLAFDEGGGGADGGPDGQPGDDAARPGDLIRVGERVVVLFRDVGTTGRMDEADLGFDFERGAIVRRLGDVFVGEGDVQWASRN